MSLPFFCNNTASFCMNTSPQRDQHNKTLQNICNIEWGLQMLKLYITVNTFPASNIRNQLFISKLDEAWPNHRSRHTQPLITFLLCKLSCSPRTNLKWLMPSLKRWYPNSNRPDILIQIDLWVPSTMHGMLYIISSTLWNFISRPLMQIVFSIQHDIIKIY